MFISDQIGISKPNKKLYLRACAECGVKPSETMYVGDHPLNDVGPAKAVGMTAVRHRRPSGKHANEEGPVKPDYEIGNLTELLAILREDFGMRRL